MKKAVILHKYIHTYMCVCVRARMCVCEISSNIIAPTISLVYDANSKIFMDSSLIGLKYLFNKKRQVQTDSQP